MLWLNLLGAMTLLLIVLGRFVRKQKPLEDELYSTRMAIEHLSSGVAWVPADGKLGSANVSLAAFTKRTPAEMAGRDWLEIFPQSERERVKEAYRHMLRAGSASIGALRFGGSGVPAAQIVLVAAHDHKARLVGHHCIIESIAETAERRAGACEAEHGAFANMTA